MDRAEFLENIETEIKEILNQDYSFGLYKTQVFVESIGAEFNKTYNEQYLWNRALFLSSSACILLQRNLSNGIAIKALKQAAEVYEYLSSVSQKFDRSYCLILSAICYDIAGYQANAMCMVKRADEYGVVSEDADIDLTLDNFVLSHLRRILLKKIPSAYANIRIESGESQPFVLAVQKFYRHVLNGDVEDYNESLEVAYEYFRKQNNIYISHLTFLLLLRFKIYGSRSIWNILRDQGKTSEEWTKYIKLLSNNYYDTTSVRPEQNRISIFEFWTSQINAINNGILQREESFVIQMPTSAGKTFIAELVILDELVKHPQQKCLYIAPFRALTNQIDLEISKLFSKLGYSVSTLSGSYEVDEFDDFLFDEADLLVATPEKIDLLMRLKPDIISKFSLVVIDEGHILGNFDPRANLVESLIIKIKLKSPSIRFLFVSAVTPKTNSQELSNWFSNREDNYILSTDVNGEEWQPTRKIIGKFSWEGGKGVIVYPFIPVEYNGQSRPAFIRGIINKEKFVFHNAETGKKNTRNFPGPDKSETAASLAYKFAEQGNCLVYCSQPAWALSVGKALLRLLRLREKSGIQTLNQLNPHFETESYFLSVKWFGKDSEITECISRGIGIHYGDMPEPLRRAVEKDYRNKLLRILVCTNTIAQGLNFPIKTVIIHSVVINGETGQKISVRDFWNVIGRAGRAGTETEGQIIFLSLTRNDSVIFEEYTNKENIEKVLSLFTVLLQKRLPSETLNGLLEALTEPLFLELMVEESLGTSDEEIVEKIIGNSLFRIQAVPLQLNIAPIRQGLRNVVKKIREKVTTDQFPIFAKTGFSVASNILMWDFVRNNLAELDSASEKNSYKDFLKCCLSFLIAGDLEESELGSKLEGLKEVQNETLLDFVLCWIEGYDIEVLKTMWQSNFPDRFKNKMDIFISQMLSYKLPWTVTMLIQMFALHKESEVKDLPTNIKNLPSFLKNGLNNELACFARSLGISNRTTASVLAIKSGKDTFKSFAVWLANLTNEDLKEFQFNQFEIQNVLETSLRLTYGRNRLSRSFNFDIKGVYYDQEKRENSLLVVEGEDLNYKRIPDNEFDPFAIELYFKNLKLGYVPREISKIIAPEIDLNGKSYKIEIAEVIRNVQGYNDIHVRMSEI